VLRRQSVEAYAAAYSEALAGIAGPKVACGVSLGGVVVLGLQVSGLLGILSIDPPMRPHESPELCRVMEAVRSSTAVAAEREYVSGVFGVTATGVQKRDYFPLLSRLRCPVSVLAGSDAADPPSVLSDQSAAELAAHPLVSFRRVREAGHSVWRSNGPEVVRELERLLMRVNEKDEDATRGARARGAGSSPAAPAVARSR
jgi:hypothetical protein